MKAVVYRGKEQIAMKERPVPVPGEGKWSSACARPKKHSSPPGKGTKRSR
jgi:hypothetical protein